ncbi:mannose-P-dolichol utilization defect 1 protein [Acrodontium crateriforme]|uniref:Mannose-P-dolichol utilization defect 1 protein homolog n=1 Tax=Acrodontium crateriforme TaxID=150365 RepID=A0AAQ3RB95_9PEZI|nr:mannose-P-dolichol utilization defect 1 protein [Acrodontium crateriforme]
MESLEQSLRSVLQPLTHNLPAPITNAATQLLGDSCYRSLVHDINISDSVCMKLAISKALGVGIIGASSIVKIPQLLKLINSRSAEGVSFLSYLLETAAYLIGLAYNVRNEFPFSTYGEVALIAIQNVAISVLVLQYSGKGPAAAVFVAGLAGAGYALLNESITSMETLKYFQAGAGALGVASKLPQIVTIFQQGGTGQLSAFAVFNYLIGSLTRIFTTLQEVDDKLILYGFIAGFILNAVLAAQMAYYWNGPATKETKSKGNKAARREKVAIDATGSGKSSSSNTPKKNTPSTRRRG